MDAFISTLFTFPTIFFTGLVILAVILWLAIILNITKITAADKLLNTSLGVDEDGQSTAPFIRAWQKAGVPLSVGWSLWAVMSWVLCLVAVALIYPYLPNDTWMIFAALGILVLVPVIAGFMTLALLPRIKPQIDQWIEAAKAKRLQAPPAEASETATPEQTRD